MPPRPNSSAPRNFPTLRLLVPPLVPITLFAALLVGHLLGHQWNAHGSGLVLLVTAEVALVVALVIELFTLGPAIAALQSTPIARTPINIFLTGFAATYILASAILLAIFFLTAS